MPAQSDGKSELCLRLVDDYVTAVYKARADGNPLPTGEQFLVNRENIPLDVAEEVRPVLETVAAMIEFRQGLTEDEIVTMLHELEVGEELARQDAEEASFIPTSPFPDFPREVRRAVQKGLDEARDG